MAKLRQVLEYFERQSDGISLSQMAQDLGLERAILQDMIDYWVRKGRLRDASTTTCTSCDCAQGCPYVIALPHHYELVGEGASADVASSSSSGQHCR
jgi:hypothetical protein